jgi:hypothetical protein
VSALLFAGAVAAIAIAAGVATSHLAVPWFRLYARRRESWAHVPLPEEIWVQDDGILYIEGVSESGVEILSIDSVTRRPERWKDSWAEWRARLRARTVYFTGTRRPLNGVGDGPGAP